MQVFKFLFWVLTFCLLCFACRKETVETIKQGNVVYQLDTIPLYSSNAQKTRRKTPSQFFSILYANLFQQSIASNQLNDLDVLSSAIGDKQAMNELIIRSYITGPLAKIPTDKDMRANVEQFVTNTYLLFNQRKPTQIEKAYLGNMIRKDNGLTAQDIYTSFALSNEYQYY
jgi:hypothetical protein